MVNTVFPTSHFENKFKRLVNKFPSLEKELVALEFLNPS
jgi:hypothetical protein